MIKLILAMLFENHNLISKCLKYFKNNLFRNAKINFSKFLLKIII